MKVVLGWLVGEEEGGEYKCEVSSYISSTVVTTRLLQVTYLGGQGPISCPVVQGLGRVVVVRPPTRVQLLVIDTLDTDEDSAETEDSEDNGNVAHDVTNTTLGPYPEDSLVRLQCVATGGSPAPDISWYIGDR